MNFPEKVIFKVSDLRTRQPVENLAVLLQLHAFKKNDYFVGPILSDRAGCVTLTKNDCLHEIESSQSLFIMDYGSDLKDCLPKSTLKIMTKEQIHVSIEQKRKFSKVYGKYWDCSETFLDRLAAAVNDQYLSDTFGFEEAQLHQSDPIIIEVRRKPD